MLSIPARAKGDALIPNKDTAASLCIQLAEGLSAAGSFPPLHLASCSPVVPFQFPSLVPTPPTHWLLGPPVFGLPSSLWRS